jgi:hypothetical protein
MSEYQLQIKQIVDYPRCRIYRQFVQSLINDRSIRINGGSGLFCYTILCSYSNFRTSYRRIDGISYTVYPGEWIVTTKELSQWFRVRFHWQALEILEYLQKMHLISFISLNRGKVIKYRISDWEKHNTVLDYNCPCQKDSGFFFMPLSSAAELISTERCSEMDIVLDLWLSTIYNDTQVQGSDVGPVVYLRNGTGSPIVSYSELSVRWGISKATVGRVLKHLEQLHYIKLISFPGRKGSVIYLQNYLSTMFQISDVLIDKEEVAMVLKINLALPEEGFHDNAVPDKEHEVTVSDDLSSVSKQHIEIVLQKMAKVLDTQGLSCFRCSKSKYKLFPLSDDCLGNYLQPMYESSDIRFGVMILCGSDKPVRTFELTLSPIDETIIGRY